MAVRRRRKVEPSSDADVQIVSLPFPRGMMESELNEFRSAIQGRVPPPIMLSPETLRYMAERSHVFQAILRKRSSQVAQFSRRPMFDGDTGFEVVPREAMHAMTPAEAKEARRIEDMLLRTGTIWNPDRHDNLRTALQKLVFNTYVYDAMVVEPVFDDRGKLLEWYVLDGGSIHRCNPDVYEPCTETGRIVRPVSYVQMMHEMVVAEWNASELIYAIRNPSPDLYRYGYGMPELELLIDAITLEIEILTWAKSILANSSVPEGLIILKSNRKDGASFAPLGSGQTIEDTVRLLQHQMAGAQNAGRMVVFQVPHGDDAAYYEANIKNREMPFAGLFELVQNVICAYMEISPAELDIVRGTMQKGSSFVKSEAKAAEVRTSKLNGMVNLLYILGEVLDRLVAYINPDFCVMFRGVDHVREQERHNLEAAMVKSGRLTINDLRRMGNKPPYKEWWGDLPLIPQVLQIAAAERGIPGFGVSRIWDGEVGKPGISGQPGTRVRGRRPSPKPF